MVKVAAFKLDGYELVFYPQDHEPKHFHLSQIGERWEITVLFMLCTPTYQKTDQRDHPDGRTNIIHCRGTRPENYC